MTVVWDIHWCMANGMFFWLLSQYLGSKYNEKKAKKIQNLMFIVGFILTTVFVISFFWLYLGVSKAWNTHNIGWTVQSGSNIVCDMTCTSACIFGFDEGSSTIVNCTDATSEKCLCGGSN